MEVLKLCFSIFYIVFSIFFLLKTQLNNPKSKEENLITSCILILALLYLFTLYRFYGFLSLPVLCITSISFLLGSYSGFKPIFRNITITFGEESIEKTVLSNYVGISFLIYFLLNIITFIVATSFKSNAILELFDVWSFLFTTLNFIFLIYYLMKYEIFTIKIIFINLLTICFAMGLFELYDIIVVYSNIKKYSVFGYNYEDPTMILDIIWNTVMMVGVMIIPRLFLFKRRK